MATESPTSPPTPTPTSVPPTPTARPTYPPSTYLEGLAIIPQKFNNCGPTNLTMVLRYYGIEADQLDIASVIRPNYEDRNVSPEELAAYVREQTGSGSGRCQRGRFGLAGSNCWLPGCRLLWNRDCAR
ncbi:MAG: C39 family peptidase [Chloroflexota bacterium]